MTIYRFALGILCLAASVASPPVVGADTPPAWAYPVAPADLAARDDGVPRRVPNSSVTYALPQLRDRFFAPDWHPADYPPMPSIVATGRKPEVFACGFCHRADGSGSPPNSALAGLPAAYIVQQVKDYKSGARTTAVPGRGVQMMIDLAKAATDEEIAAAAAYFSTLQPRQRTRVIETDVVPKTFLRSHHYAVSPTGGTEPIGNRIIEVPENLELVMYHDSRARFIAYVPLGSVARGEALVKTGGAGKSVACASCHGPDLRGAGVIPGIAGRSTNYTVRQLYDFKHGFRAGPLAIPMKDVVARLEEEDMLVIAAYLATQAP